MLVLYKGFKYDNSYDYIKTFSTKEEQTSYFNSLSKIKLDETNYIKQHENFTIDIPFDELVDEGVNYISFNNGYKDIFAFIIEKQYLNERNTRIIYEVDVIQTYMFDFTIQNSFIERKVCTINEIADFDEGLNIGEHEIKENEIVINKDSNYFAMFNGFKEQQLIFDGDILKSVVDMPYSTSKPLTVIDGIQYPLYFMPLKESYREATYTDIENPTGTNTSGVIESARKLIGKPYVWGGNYAPLGNDNGTDCSGLCMWAYNDSGLLDKVGIVGRWVTGTMYNKANIISLENAQKGDVLFSNFDENGKPQHVMLLSEIRPVTPVGNNLTIIEAQQTGTDIMERNITYSSSNHKIGRLI